MIMERSESDELYYDAIEPQQQQPQAATAGPDDLRSLSARMKSIRNKQFEKYAALFHFLDFNLTTKF